MRTFKTGVPYDYDLEAFYQFGEIGARAIDAGGVALLGGRTFVDFPWSPRLGVLAGGNTGGGSRNTSNTFYPPFPRGAYFGNLRAIGPENTMAASLSLDLHPTDAVALTGGAFAFWRSSLRDGVYALSGQEIAPPGAAGRFAGWQPTVSASWQVTGHLSLNAAYETFRLGTFLGRTPGLKPIDYTAAWLLFRF